MAQKSLKYLPSILHRKSLLILDLDNLQKGWATAYSYVKLEWLCSEQHQVYHLLWVATTYLFDSSVGFKVSKTK